MSANTAYSWIGFICVAILAVFLLTMGPAMMREAGLSPFLFPVLLAAITFGLARGEKHSQRRKWAVVIGIATGLSLLMAVGLTEQWDRHPSQNAPTAPTNSEKATPRPASSPSPISTSVPVAKPEQTRPAAAPGRRVIETTIDELLGAYAANQVAAERKYGSATIKLGGTVVRVREALGTGFLVLKSRDSGQTHEFGFSDAGTKELGSLNPGDQVSIICPTVWEAMSIVMVGGCSDIEVRR